MPPRPPEVSEAGSCLWQPPGWPAHLPGAHSRSTAADLGVTPLGDALPAEQVATGRGC